jgi:hypothetical protein
MILLDEYGMDRDGVRWHQPGISSESNYRKIHKSGLPNKTKQSVVKKSKRKSP